MGRYGRKIGITAVRRSALDFLLLRMLIGQTPLRRRASGKAAEKAGAPPAPGHRTRANHRPRTGRRDLPGPRERPDRTKPYRAQPRLKAGI